MILAGLPEGSWPDPGNPGRISLVCRGPGPPERTAPHRRARLGHHDWKHAYHHTVHGRIHGRRGRGRHRSHRPPGHRDRRRVGDRHRDRAGAGRGRRRSDPGGPQRRGRRAHRRGHYRDHRQQAGPRGPAGPGRPGLRGRVRGGLGWPAGHAHQQRGDHGLSPDAHSRRLGDAVRHQPPGPFRPRHPAARRSRRRGQRPGGIRQFQRAPALAGRVRGHPLPRAAV